MPVPPRNLVTQRRACAWRFEFCFCMSQHHNIGLIVNNARNPFQAARIISYATEKADSEIKVTGLIAGDQMRGCAVQRYLSHVEIRNLQLTPIEGGHTDRSNDPFIRMFLSLPAANDSAFAQAGHPPPATPEHGVRVDLRAPSIVRARAGRPPRQSPSRAPCRAVLVGPQAQPLPRLLASDKPESCPSCLCVCGLGRAQLYK